MKTRSGKVFTLSKSNKPPHRRNPARASKPTRKRASFSTTASKVSKQLGIPFRTHAMRHPLTKHLHSRTVMSPNKTAKIVPKPRTKTNMTWDDSPFSHESSIPSMSSIPSASSFYYTNSNSNIQPKTRKRINPNQFIKVKLKQQNPTSSNEDEWWDL